jgi:Raf kinase inhibitor-like YbhB/YbcL family protein
MKRKESMRKALAFFSWALTATLATAMAAEGNLRIRTTAWSGGREIPAKYTCTGSGTSPSLQIDGTPAAAKSLVLIVDDPDAPAGLFTHWMVWNMDPKMKMIGEGGLPGGLAGRNDFGENGYGAPCPPSGSHRYYFRVFALDRRLDLAAGSNRRQLDAAMKGHVIVQGEFMGRYSKK